jgi:hypothetical protein
MISLNNPLPAVARAVADIKLHREKAAAAPDILAAG